MNGIAILSGILVLFFLGTLSLILDSFFTREIIETVKITTSTKKYTEDELINDDYNSLDISSLD